VSARKSRSVNPLQITARIRPQSYMVRGMNGGLKVVQCDQTSVLATSIRVRGEAVRTTVTKASCSQPSGFLSSYIPCREAAASAGFSVIGGLPKRFLHIAGDCGCQFLVMGRHDSQMVARHSLRRELIRQVSPNCCWIGREVGGCAPLALSI
jgi:hypothetical protein